MASITDWMKYETNNFVGNSGVVFIEFYRVPKQITTTTKNAGEFYSTRHYLQLNR